MLIQPCEHKSTRPTLAVKSGGAVCVCLQCQQCGERVGGDLRKRDYDVERLPEFDAAFRDRMRQREADTRRSAWEQERTAQWWGRYDAYRQSQHWQQLRRRVIARDGFRCQNCFCRVTDGSAHVHHLSYDGFNAVGHSFAFECVTLCRTCHEDYHPHMQSTRHTPPVMEVTW